IQHLLELQASDPLRQAHLSTTFGPGRDEGTEAIDFWLRLPDAWLVPDAGDSPYGNTPNSNYAVRLWGDDAGLIHEGVMITRSVAGGPFYIPDFMRYPANRRTQSLTGDGLHSAGQGASGMSALGGTLRRGELTGSAPIRHAIKINPWAEKYCHYSDAVPGWRWPARMADGYAASGYNRDADPAIVMGSLFAIPLGVTAADLGLATEPGRKLLFTLQNYGTYFTEDAAWDTWDLIVERDAELEFAAAYGFNMGSATWKAEVNRLMQALHVVTNNAPDAIGGGGTPLQPLAPAFVGSAPPDPDPDPDPPPATGGALGAGASGSVSGDDAAMLISVMGAGLWGQTDAAYTVWRSATGDFDYQARVVSQTAADPWALAGVMLRADGAADAAHLSLAVTPAHGVALRYRLLAGGVSYHVAGPLVSAPCWLKLSRRGNELSAWYANDGVNWSLIASRAISLPATARLGVVVTGGLSDAAASAQLAQLQHTPVSDE
ncbi:MAG: hypothetical protein PF961_03325, partial [Planctomycetota bacterium]|nr:hypothetical protein [Planctomycetota bacterium]